MDRLAVIRFLRTPAGGWGAWISDIDLGVVRESIKDQLRLRLYGFSFAGGGCYYWDVKQRKNGKASKKFKINNEKCFHCEQTSRSATELVVEWFTDRLEDVAPIIKEVLCQGGITKEGEGAEPEIILAFSQMTRHTKENKRRLSSLPCLYIFCKNYIMLVFRTKKKWKQTTGDFHKKRKL